MNQSELININLILNSPYWKCYWFSIIFIFPNVFNSAEVLTISWSLRSNTAVRSTPIFEFLNSRKFGSIQIEIRKIVADRLFNLSSTFRIYYLIKLIDSQIYSMKFFLSTNQWYYKNLINSVNLFISKSWV